MRLVRDRQRYPVLGARRLDGVEAVITEEVSGELQVLVVVLDDEHQVFHACTAAARRTGRVNPKVLPPPGVLWSQMRPP